MYRRSAKPGGPLNSSHINTVHQQANDIVRQHLGRTQGEDISTEDLANILEVQSQLVVAGNETSQSNEVVQAKRLIYATILVMTGQTIDPNRITEYATRLVASLPPPTTT